MDRPVPRSHIEKIIQAGLLAPTSSNRQHWRAVVVDDKRLIQLLHRRVGAQEIVTNAPVVIAVVYDPMFNARHSAHIQSAAAAIQNMMLRAYSMGYGTCWIAGLGDDDELKTLLSIPKRLMPLCLFTLGRPAEHPPPPPKWGLDEIISFNRYSMRDQDMPTSIRPSRCTFKQIANHQKYLSRSSYLGKDYEIFAPVELAAVRALLARHLGTGKKRVLSFYGYDGTVLRSLRDLLEKHETYDVEFSEPARDFVKVKVPGINYVVSTFDSKLPSNSVDVVLLLFSVEKIPAPTKTFQEAHRVLKKDGKIIIVFKNKFSLYGLMYFAVERLLGVKGINNVFPLSAGPFQPHASYRMLKKLSVARFVPVERQGIFFVPSELFAFRDRLGGYMKRHSHTMSALRILIRPMLGLGVMLFRLTTWFKPYAWSSSSYVIAKKK